MLRFKCRQCSSNHKENPKGIYRRIQRTWNDWRRMSYKLTQHKISYSSTHKKLLKILPKLKETFNKFIKAKVISKNWETNRLGQFHCYCRKKIKYYVYAQELNQYILQDYKTIASPEEISNKPHCTVFTTFLQL